MAVNVVLKSIFDDKGIRQAQDEFGKIGKTVGVAFAAVGAAIAVGSAVALQFAGDSIKAAEGVAQANARLEQINKSMGLFGNETEGVTQRLIKFAEANELNVAVDAEVIKATQAKLLTFRELGKTADEAGGAFDRATMAALDLAAAGFGSAETNAVQLGKALQDPIKGITALGRAGVTFTAQERENIKVLVESGKQLEAQNVILQALETQVGGTAEATASASDKMQLAFDNVKESVGEALLPAFNELTDEIVKLTPEIADALTPIAAELARIFRAEVLPAIQNFTKWLASPQGVQTVRDLTRAILDGVKGFIDFTKKVIDNWEAIKVAAVTIASVVVILKTLQTALQLATAAQLLFNVAVKANPYVIAATAIATLVAGVIALGAAIGDNQEEFDTTKWSAEQLRGEIQKLKAAHEDGLVPTEAYTKRMNQLRLQLVKVGLEAQKALPHLQELNNIRLPEDVKRANDAWAKSWIARGKAAETTAKKEKDAQAAAAAAARTARSASDANKATGKTPAELAQEAFERVQKLVRDTQKKIVQAQGDYDKAVKAANKDYLEQVVKLREEYGKRLQDIVVSSQNRLRDAFRSAIGTSLSDLFGQEGERSVTNLVENLRKRVMASRQLIANSSALASLGFTQTFIEQVVSAGVETGNELAGAILSSTPEVQSELKGLFNALEKTSERGMDQLAKRIYEEQGLATDELRNLYEQTNIELQQALGDQQVEFQRALESAAIELRDKLADIKADFEEDVAGLKGAYGGLKGTIDSVSRSLDSMIGKADSAAKAAANAAITAANATRAAVADITGTTPSETDLGLPGGAEGLRGFGDPTEMRRLAAIQAAGSALGKFGQEFINMVTGQRSFIKDGQRTVVAGGNDAMAARLLAQGFVEEFALSIDRAALDLALGLAEEVYGVDIGGISTPGQVGGNTFNITVNAGMGTDPITVGKEIVDAIKRFERSSGQVFVGV